ncbi:MAG: helix-turn-helix domain-containing protein, partial [Chloroflexota bacterium]|nr:helix-turn-helix domain-containing protein [Chloroflexota bacterium]
DVGSCRGHREPRDESVALPPLVALVRGGDARMRIRDALHGRAQVVFIDRVAEVRASLSGLRTELLGVILEMTDREGCSTVPTIQMLRRELPTLPIIAYCRLGTGANGEVRDAALAGAHELLFHGVDDIGVSLRAVLQAAVYSSVAETVYAALAAVVPAAVHPVVRFVCKNAGSVTQVSTVASALGFHRRTLVNLCARHELPTPQILIAWCRLAIIAEALSRSTKTVEALAMDMDFPSDTALRNMIKRYTGQTATELRAGGGLPRILALFELRRKSHRSKPEATRPGRSRLAHVEAAVRIQ